MWRSGFALWLWGARRVEAGCGLRMWRLVARLHGPMAPECETERAGTARGTVRPAAPAINESTLPTYLHSTMVLAKLGSRLGWVLGVTMYLRV